MRTGTDSRAGGSLAVRPGATSLGNSLLALAAIGSGLVLLAAGAGSSILGAVPLVGLGAGSLVWAVIVLVRDHVPGLRASFAATVGAIIVWVALQGLASVGLTTVPPLVPMLSSTLMLLVIAAVLAVRLRRVTVDEDETPGSGDRRPADPSRPHAGRYVLSLFAGAVVVAALTTPALALTAAGEFAVPHGTHGSLHGDP